MTMADQGPPTKLAQAQLCQAQKFLQAGRTQDGRRILEELLLAHPHCVEARDLLLAHGLVPEWKRQEWQQQDNYFYFVDEGIRQYHGAEARCRIAEKNDARFLSAHGIVQVDRDRWQEAQRYEKKTWMEQNRSAVDDRNVFHAENFDGYAVLRGQAFPRIIELGCGPFTNLRLIAPLLQEVREIDLLDPLIDSYLTHPHCTYRDGAIAGVPVRTIGKPIEDFAPMAPYDLVVMINVLEHCFDVPKIFDTIASMLRPGGFFVFSDVTTDCDSLKAQSTYDAGHPIRILDSYLVGRLQEQYVTRYWKSFRDVTHLTHREICHYFVGQLRSKAGPETPVK